MGRRTKKSAAAETRQEARASTESRSGRATGVLASLIVVAGGIALAQWAKNSDRFSVRSIEVSGQRRAQVSDLLALADLRPGINLFRVDPGRASRSLAAHPWVIRARVERRFPSRLRVVVEEYEPLALAALDHLYYVDAEARVVKRYAPGEMEPLPVITGLSRARIERGDSEEHARLGQAVSFVVALSSAGGSALRSTLSEVHVHPILGVSLVDQHGSLVRFGEPPWEPKFEKLEQVQRALVVNGASATEISLVGGHRADRVVARIRKR